MKILLQASMVIAGALLGLVIGFAWPHQAAQSTSVQTTNIELTATASSQLSRSGPSSVKQDDSPLATHLESELTLSTGVTRWLLWVDALEKAVPTDFPRLYRLAHGNPTATKLVGARWIEVAPRHLFDTLLSNSPSLQAKERSQLAELLFEEWPKRDPDAAIAALNDPASKTRQNEDWRWTVAYAVMEKDVERGFRLMAEWNVENIGFGPRGINAVAKWTRANPRHAAEFMMTQSSSYGFKSGAEAVGQEWGKIDPAAALAFAASQPGDLGAELATSALKEWAAKNPQKAADWLARTDNQTRNRLSSGLVEAWAKKDFSGALDWCEANLTGSVLAQSVASVFKTVAQKDVGAAATLVLEMDPSRVRSEAAVAVARKWFPDLSSGQTTKSEALAWMASLDPDSVKRVLDQVTWTWATSDATSMAAFLSNRSDPAPSYSYSVVARELARKNPQEALAWASHLPERQGLDAGGDAFSEWRASQPEAATEWLNALPTDDVRREHFFKDAIRNLAWKPQAAEQLALMPPNEQTVARGVIESMTLPEDRRARLLAVLKR